MSPKETSIGSKFKVGALPLYHKRLFNLFTVLSAARESPPNNFYVVREGRGKGEERRRRKKGGERGERSERVSERGEESKKKEKKPICVKEEKGWSLWRGSPENRNLCYERENLTSNFKINK